MSAEPTSAELAKGFTCRTFGCHRHHPFGPYVYAHWDLQVHHTCGGCGALSTIQRGKVTLSKPGKRKPLDTSKINGAAPTDRLGYKGSHLK